MSKLSRFCKKNLLRKCPYCNFEFPVKESKNLTAFYLSNLDLISKNADILSKIKDVCLNDEKNSSSFRNESREAQK